MNESSPLRTLGRYRLRYRVASGGMASVYLAQLATDAGFSKWVAIKVIHSHIAEDARFVEMFLDEARLVAKLDHPHICSVFDFGLADGTYYLAMEYLHGESLERLARRMARSGGVDPRVAARIVCDAARGLHHAHELRMEDGRPANVVHRDVSPQNTFVLYSGVTKVVDFGIARSAERAADKTRTGELKGKLAYMSPEQIGAPDRVDRRTDVWALGVMLWEVTLGRRLFRRSNPAATVAAITQPVRRPRELVPSYPEALERIVLKALARDLDERYATAAELARDLERFIASSGEPCSAEDVASYVSASFADEKDGRERMLSADPTSVSAVPEIIELPSETDLPIMEGDPSVSAPHVATPSTSAEARPPSRPRRWVLPLAIVLSVAAGFAVALRVVAPAEPTSASPDETEPVVAPAGAAAHDDAGPASGGLALADADAGATPRREPDAGSLAASPAGQGLVPSTDDMSAETSAPQRPVDAPRPHGRRPPRRGSADRDPAPADMPTGAFGTVALTTRPSGLAVYRGSQLLGRTPLQRRLPVGSHSLRVVAPTGESHRVMVVIEAFATSVVSLEVVD